MKVMHLLYESALDKLRIQEDLVFEAHRIFLTGNKANRVTHCINALQTGHYKDLHNHLLVPLMLHDYQILLSVHHPYRESDHSA